MKIKMNLKITLITFLLAFTFLGCKKENTFSDYKYNDKPEVLACNGLNSKLYQEALYSFEDDILNYYGKAKPNTSLVQAYSQLLRNSIYGRLKFEDVISEHTVKVFEVLKNEDDLWDANNTKSHLNYSSNIIKCISNNMQDKSLKTTFDALISTNSLSPKLFGTPLMSKYRTALNDKYLATYIALDLYYSKLFDIDLSKVNFDEPEPLDFNVIPQKSDTSAQTN
ncbi:hypothetical protein MBM09_04920 [Flaviramulus sp. BrNp1-15]|uniref:hypothetical protein n=1 Tax=Flaviramulus sp. BrNp1-15 TaxID=2916754 RepID=UPI001EE7FB5C|nr:hypothetical protein [Flaviramulus sp. BrNp1-15]ULC60333.1 hypothetical protein MBM09_04920 [Flaviramulus sp. BrNp1-15]